MLPVLPDPYSGGFRAAPAFHGGGIRYGGFHRYGGYGGYHRHFGYRPYYGRRSQLPYQPY